MQRRGCTQQVTSLVSPTSLIFEGFSLLCVLVLPCFQRGWKAETQVHNMYHISQVLAGGLSPGARREPCISPWRAQHQIRVPAARALLQPRVPAPAGAPAQAAAALPTVSTKEHRHLLSMGSKQEPVCRQREPLKASECEKKNKLMEEK